MFDFKAIFECNDRGRCLITRQCLNVTREVFDSKEVFECNEGGV